MEGVIQLDRLTQSDAEKLALLANNKNIWDMVRNSMPYPYSISDAEYFINLTLKETIPGTFAIRYKHQLCGVIGLVVQEDVYRKSAELGYWVGEEYWGKGIATEAVKLVLHYGFNNLNLIRIQAGVYEHNTSSMRVLIKNGFEKEGVLRKAVIKNDRILNEYRFAKLRSR